MDFTKIPRERIKEVQDELNNRPHKTPGWYTPHEKFAENVALKLKSTLP